MDAEGGSAMSIVVVIPLKTITGNPREHWAVRAKRVKTERSKVARRMPPKRPGPLLEVTLTRCAPRSLDLGDNLASSMKGVRDQVATWLRIDDASPLVRWVYQQDKAPLGAECVRIEVKAVQQEEEEQ